MEKKYKSSQMHQHTFTIRVPQNTKTEFTEEEELYLWPIAEVLALMDGNAFLTESQIIRSYLPIAHVIFDQNGGMNGWSSELSWISHNHSENAKIAYEHYITMRKLTNEKK